MENVLDAVLAFDSLKKVDLSDKALPFEPEIRSIVQGAAEDPVDTLAKVDDFRATVRAGIQLMLDGKFNKKRTKARFDVEGSCERIIGRLWMTLRIVFQADDLRNELALIGEETQGNEENFFVRTTIVGSKKKKNTGLNVPVTKDIAAVTDLTGKRNLKLRSVFALCHALRLPVPPNVLKAYEL